MSRKSSLFLILAAVVIAYFPSLFFKLTYFDDQVAVIANHSFLSRWSNFFLIFQRDTFSVFGGGQAGYYRPLGAITMFWDAHCSGVNPFSYHLTNLILHAAASCVFYLLLNRISGAANKLNLALALLFALHPLSVPAVAWIPGRGETLLALFIFLSFYFFLPESQNFVLHQFFLLCALFIKESALVFPVLLVCFVCLKINRPGLVRIKDLWRYCLGWIFCALFFIFAKYSAVGSFASGLGIKEILGSVAANAGGIYLYLGKIFFPVNLSVLPVLKDANLIFGKITAILIFALLLGGWLRSGKQKETGRRPDFKIIGFGLFWFLVFLIPSFVYPDLNRFPGFLEQRAYLPLAGILFAIQEAGLFLELPAKKYQMPLLRLAAALILLFAILTFNRDFDFRGRMAFWSKAAKQSPHSALARKNLGAMFYLEGNMAAAENEFNAALALAPDEPIVHNNLGLIFMNAGKFAEAQEEYRKELLLNPGYDNVYYNFGLLKYKEKDFAQARELWQKTVTLNPGYADAWRALINLSLEMKEAGEARRYLEKAQNIGLQL